MESRHGAGPVAQRLEQGTHNPLVGGSNPSGPIFDFLQVLPTSDVDTIQPREF